MKLRYIILYLMIFVYGLGSAQARSELFFRRLGDPKETFGDEVQQICVDRDGYAWLATTDRLLRFDGRDARHYGSGAMTRLATGPAGELYASGNNTAYIYNRADDRFDSIPGLTKVTNDNNGNLWKFPADGRSARTGRRKFVIPGTPAAALMTRKGEEAYLLDTSGRLWHFPSRGKASAVASCPLSVAEGAALFEDTAGNIWFWDSFSPGINRLDGSGTVTMLRNQTVRSLDQDSKGYFWIASNDSGLLYMTPSMESAGEIAVTGLPSNHTSFVMLDGSDRLWVGAPWGAAMSRLGRLGILRHRIPRAVDISSLLCMPDGSRWIGMDGDGIARVDDSDRLSGHRSSTAGNAPFSRTTALLPLDAERFAVTTYGEGAFIYDIPSGRFTPVEGAPSHSRAIIRAPRSGSIWIGSHMNGLYGFDSGLRLQKRFTTANSGLKTDFINDLCASAEDTVYIATGYGVYSFHAPDGVPHPAAPALTEVSARCVAADDRGNLWIGTARGLLRYRIRNGNLSRVESVGQQCINSLEVDDRGHLWALSPAGLNRIIESPDGNLHLTLYQLGEVIPAINIVSMSLHGDRIFLCGNGKFVEVTRPTATRERTARVLLPDYGPDTREIPLTVGTTAGLRVAATSLTETLLNVVYRFDGSEEWKEAADGIIPLDSLRPGTHTLRIRLATDIDSPIREVTLRVAGLHPSRGLLVAGFILLAASAAGLFLLLRRRRRGDSAPESAGAATPAEGAPAAKGAGIAPRPVSASSQDERFLERARDVVEASMADTDFGVDRFAEQMCVSRSGLYKRMMALTGISPNEFIRQFRLRRGRDLLRADAGTISEIAFRVGMAPRQFSRLYKEFFGVLPSRDNPRQEKTPPRPSPGEEPSCEDRPGQQPIGEKTSGEELSGEDENRDKTTEQ